MSAKLWRSQEEEWMSNYYITRVKTGSQVVWRSDELEIRCGRENQHPADWAPQAPVEQLRRTGKKRYYGHKTWGLICCSSVRVSNSLSHTTLSIKWEVYDFSKELCRSSLLCHCVLHADVCVLYGYTTRATKVRERKKKRKTKNNKTVKRISKKEQRKWYIKVIKERKKKERKKERNVRKQGKNKKQAKKKKTRTK